MKPTVIGVPAKPAAPKASVIRPTVIGGGASAPQPPPPKVPVKPTSIPSTPPNALPPKPPQVTPVTMPTILGTARKRIKVIVDDLRKDNTRTDEKILGKALQIIHQTNADEMTDNECVLWGKTAQETYTQCVNQNLQLSRSGTAADVMRQLMRLQEVLGSIDFTKLFGLDKGFLARLTRDSEEERLGMFDRIQNEIVQITNLLSPKENELLAHQGKVQTLIGRIRSAENEIEAFAIAAYFLAAYMRREFAAVPEKLSLADLLERRSMLLTQTLGQIRANAPLLKQQEEQPLELINCIQTMILVEVPNWLNTYASLRGVIERKQTATVTQLDELDRARKRIVENLKGSK